MKSKQVLFEISVGKTVLAERHENLVEGPFGEIHWVKLQDVAELNAGIVAEYFGFKEDEFEYRHALRESESGFLPCIRAYLSSDRELPLDTVGKLLFSTACAIVSEDKNQAGLFTSEGLNEALPSTALSAFLAKHGGKRVTSEMVVTLQSQIVAQVSGTYAARPADKVINPEARHVPAIVDDVCASARVAVCRAVDHGINASKFSVNFSEAYLIPLASALALQCVVSVGYEESLDAKGQKFLNLRQLDGENILDFKLTPSS